MPKSRQMDRLLIAPVLLATIVALTGCRAPAQVRIAEIVDKQSGQPVGASTTVTMTVCNQDGKELRTTQCQDCWETMLVQIDPNGKEQLFVQITAPGYVPWETTLGPPEAGALTVALVPLAETQAFRAQLAESAARLERLLVAARSDHYPPDTVEVPLSEALDWLRETDRRLAELAQ